MNITYLDTAQTLRAFSALESLSDNECAALVAFMRECRFTRGDEIRCDVPPGQCLYFVTRGRVRVTLATDSGHDLPLELLEAPVVVGESALGGPENDSRRLVAASDVQAFAISSTELATAARLHPGIALSVIASLASRLDGLAGRVESLTLYDASHRVVRVLLNMATAAFESGGVPVIQGVTHQELALLAGTSRETATRMISALVRRGVVATKGRRIIVDLLRLHEITSG